MAGIRQDIFDIIDAHAQKACASEYDRSVCIGSIAAARHAVSTVPQSLSDAD
jgi:hypothetical protein